MTEATAANAVARKHRRKGAGIARLPGGGVRLASQLVTVSIAPNLHHVDEEGGHGHRAYGTYSEADQHITLDDSLGFERARETFLHENLHAMLGIAGLDHILDAEGGSGLGEHLVSVLAPIMLGWLRDNRKVVAYLQEKQERPT